MAAFEQIGATVPAAREGVDQETVDAVRTVGERYKYGFSSDIDTEYAPKGLNEDIVRLISEKNGEPAWLTEWRLQAFARWKTLTEPSWAMVKYPQDRFPGSVLLRATQEHGGEAAIARRRGSGASAHLREARHPAEGTDDPRGCRGRRGHSRRGPQGGGRRGLRQRLAGHDVQGRACEGRRDLLLDLGSGARASRAGAQVSRLGRADLGQFLRDAQLGGVLGRLVRLRAAGRALPDGAVDLFPHQRREHRPVRAHADHRRQGRLCELPRGLHGAEARREPAPRRGGRAGAARGCRDQVFHGAELVPRATKRGAAASTISSPSAPIAAATAPR
jgi:hypothetical protein